MFLDMASPVHEAAMLGSATDDVNSGQSPSGNPDIRQQEARRVLPVAMTGFDAASAMIAPATT